MSAHKPVPCIMANTLPKAHLIRASISPALLRSFGKSYGLTTGQLRALLGICALRYHGILLSGKSAALMIGLTDWQGRADIRWLVKAGYVSKEKVAHKGKRLASLNITLLGADLIGKYERAERESIRRFIGRV